MNTLAKSFLQGLAVVVPIAVTAYVVYQVVVTIDGWMRIPIPGVGLAVTLASITVIGFVTTRTLGKRAWGAVERLLERLPVVKLLYSSLRQLLNAFVGEKKSFDRPVMIEVGPGVKVMGFITCDRFDDPNLIGHVAVYLPQSYNFAGNLLVVPAERVRRMDADGAQAMAFIVSGGVTGMREDTERSRRGVTTDG